MTRNNKEKCCGNITINNNLINGPGNVIVPTSPTAPTSPTSPTPPVPPTCGRVYVANEGNNNLSVIDLTTGEDLGTIGLNGEPFATYYNPFTGLINVVNSFSQTIDVVDPVTNQVIATYRPTTGASFPTNIVYDPEQNIYYVTTTRSGILLLDGTTYQQVGAITGVGINTPYDIARDPVTNYVYVTNSASNTVSIIDGSTVIGQITVGQTPTQITIDSVNRKAYVSVQGASIVSIIDLTTNTVVDQLSFPNETYRTAIDPTTNTAYIVVNNGTLAVVDGVTNEVLDVIPVGRAPRAVAISPATRLAYVSNNFDNTVSVIDLDANTVIATLPVGTRPYGIAIYEFPCE
ncbi:hypothetical protein [Geomicrobium sp. JCM 19055]|uniref:YVTN family beta-propeller repeat protein n=1 Tax=Geomicrobium sp. JCM 19055 TaxID=1460649 RepID=UPI00045ED84D|nr:hypothetical protein [Geomicrobium sp. JCM 19055]GAK01357.1 collagen triple helix repeat domain protein [Geomicrobium sp. JCM 19055]